MKRRMLAAVRIGIVTLVCSAADSAEVEKERAKLQGTWQLVSAETDGKPTPGDVCAKFRVMIAGEKFSVRFGDEVLVHDVYWDIDPTTDPKSTTDTINDGPDKGKKIRGIYRLEGDKLTTCADPLDGPRPTEFTGKAGSGQTLRLLHRVKDGVSKAEAVQAELKRFEGTWKFVSMEMNGKAVPEASLKDSRLIFEGDRFTSKGDETSAGTFAVDPTATPKTIDISVEANGQKFKILGIYELEGDSYKICSALPGKPRPVEFSGKGAGNGLTIMAREKR